MVDEVHDQLTIFLDKGFIDHEPGPANCHVEHRYSLSKSLAFSLSLRLARNELHNY